MHKSTDDRVRFHAQRLIEEFGVTQAAVAQRAAARGHRLDAQYFNNILHGRAPAIGKIDAIAAGLGVDVSTLTMPIPAPGDDSTDVQGAPVQEEKR